YAKGRLVVTPLGAGRFGWTVVRRRSKWDGTEPTPRQGSSSFPERDGVPTWANRAEPTQDLPALESGPVARACRGDPDPHGPLTMIMAGPIGSHIEPGDL